ncbi:MAG TPA: hypothetical protein VMT33_00580 [Candidatus Bathyarchaeia archaeon]|nr:hypothetical protein [Candidatus Bathyarchaeia archaeon]
MRADAVRADRNREVRRAARAWSKAGAIGAPTLSTIESRYADDRVRLRWGLAVLAGAATFLGGAAFLLALAFLLSLDRRGAAVLFMLCAAAFVVATELQVGRLRRARAGAELATGWLAALCVLTAATLWELGQWSWPIVTAVACAAGAYRWGFASLAGASWILLLVKLATFSWGRIAWIAVSVIAIVVAVSRSSLESVAPAHRRCLRVVFAGALLALYVAVDYDSVKGSTLEWVSQDRPAFGDGVLALSAVLTALLPIAILAFGIHRRDRIALAIGALLAGVSLGTWRYHLGWPPMWLTLTLGGVACFVTAIAVRRFLDRTPDREWRGMTADPLFDDPAHAAALRVAAVAGTLGHAPQAASGDRPFQAGGGTSGGGGATGRS